MQTEMVFRVEDYFTLHVKGFILDTIKSLSDICESHDPQGKQVRSWKDMLQSKLYRNGETTETAFSRIVVADLMAKEDDLSGEVQRPGGVDFDLLDTLSSSLELGRRSRRHHMQQRLESTCLNRRLCETKAGFFGLCPAGSAVGDSITVLYGGPVLYVLRPNSNDYSFIGESYVHGLMDGEAFSDEFPQHKTPTMLKLT